ncbi:hypothetical protein [Streptomyces sp. STR69]|uniref:hypothetical protein n=1 Tax=Streptomyces sp. STR69 TaxID=1796942 RepID=UPI0021C80E33|nr:hypothetical protein [Streptomyces sp. STR69]
MTAHHLLPATMRRLPPPWNDLTRDRRRRLDTLPHTSTNERAALDALTAALTGPPLPPSAPRIWSDESWELYDRIRHEAGDRLAQVMPTTDRFTREGVAGVLGQWASTMARPPVPAWWLESQLDLITEELTRRELSAWAHDVLHWLQQQPYDAPGIAAVAEQCARHGLAVHDAVSLLGHLGTPHGERALLRLVRDDRLSDGDRDGARTSLMSLRRPAREARARQPAHAEHPLLPPAVRELPYSWTAGFQWPAELPESDANITRARAILRACAPSGPVSDPVPDPDWTRDEDEEPPAWLEVRSVLREFMPYAGLVTEERMTEAMRECALMAVPGVPEDPDGEETARFTRRWVTWISGWIAGEVFTWLGMNVDDDTLVTPWAMELAERYAHFGFVPDRAVALLHWHETVPRSREALARLAADGTLPPDETR